MTTKGYSQRLQKYNGFNLIVGDFKERRLAYFSNRSGVQPQELPGGLFGISNGLLESHWPKVERGKIRLRTMLDGLSAGQPIDAETVFQEVMGDRHHVSTFQEGLPPTGFPEELERVMSPIFLEQFNLHGAPYGTRSQTLLMVNQDGNASLFERSLQVVDAQLPHGQGSCQPVWQNVQHSFECKV